MRSKLVKVFIASSAELDQDKTMFDVYFSDKNKLYRKKDIEFDHRTWKDFCSSLNDGRLQDRYNAYIRECDLVIFLFHTRLGKYTREELEVALAAFRENKERPRIFIYFYCCPIKSIEYKRISLGHCIFNGRVLFCYSKPLQKIDS